MSSVQTGSITGIVKNASGKPLEGVQVTALTKTVETNAEGLFEITGIAVGRCWVVAKHGHHVKAREVVVKTGPNDIGEIIIDTQEETDEGFEDLDDLGVQTIISFLHFSDSPIADRYHVSVHVFATNQRINRAEVITPSGVTRELQRRFWSQTEELTTWWNERELEEGPWRLVLYPEGLSQRSKTFIFDQEKLPARPSIVYPSEGSVETTTPTIRFTVPDAVDQIDLRVYEAGSSPSHDVLVDVLPVPVDSNEFLIPGSILSEGGRYGITLYVTRKDEDVRYCALSDCVYFEVDY